MSYETAVDAAEVIIRKNQHPDAGTLAREHNVSLHAAESAIEHAELVVDKHFTHHAKKARSSYTPEEKARREQDRLGKLANQLPRTKAQAGKRGYV